LIRIVIFLGFSSPQKNKKIAAPWQIEANTRLANVDMQTICFDYFIDL